MKNVTAVGAANADVADSVQVCFEIATAHMY